MTSEQPKSHVIYTGSFIDTPTLQVLRIRHDTAIGVSPEGKIKFITALTSPTPSSTDLQDLAEKHAFPTATTKYINALATTTSFFFPGLIDTHTHASQYPNIGVFGNSTLLDWLATYTFPLESSFSSLDRARDVYDRVVTQTLAHGTTFAAYYATVHVPATNLLADICLARGQRALVGRVCMDRMSPADYRDESIEGAVRDSKACIEYVQQIDPQGEIVRPVITPRFAPACSGPCLNALGVLQRETGVFAQTHISETQAEIALVKELFPANKNYADVYDAAGLLTEKMILAHAVHLTPEEICRIQETRTKISHCPISNTCLTSGSAKVKDLLRAGIQVGLGTDMSGGCSPSILGTARQAMLVSRHVAMDHGEETKLSVSEALFLATKGGAGVVGLEDKVGSFEVGMDWDAQMVRLDDSETPESAPAGRSPVEIFGWESWENRIAKWLYCGDDRNVKAVWVKGRMVHSDGQTH